MKRSYNLFLGLLVCIAIFFSGCKKGLEQQPISAISNASFWKTENDAKAVLTGMYIKLRNQTNQSIFLLGEGRAETLERGTAGTLNYEVYYENSLTSSSITLVSWGDIYSIINHANLLLKYVPGIPFSSESTKNDILAQAYTMRAYVYFVMTRSWGALPLRTESIEGYDSQTVQIERSSQADVFALIKSDLDKALQLFPTNNFTTGRNTWNKPAANALKAEVYLWTGKLLNGGATDFTTALNACTAAQTADVMLLSDYAGIFSNKGNKEVLMSVFYEPINAVNNFFQFGSISAPQYTGLVVDAATQAAFGSPPGENNVYSPSALVRNQFTADDKRKNATFLDIYAKNAAGVFVYNASIFMKGRGTVQAGIRYFTDDVILYRYADLVLMKAEAKNALNQDPSAEMNLVRQRAYGADFAVHTFVPGTKVQNDNAILKERLFELAFEGKRWWDLVRFGKAFELVPALKGKSDPNLLLFPIHIATLSGEPKIKQNPGY